MEMDPQDIREVDNGSDDFFNQFDIISDSIRFETDRYIDIFEDIQQKINLKNVENDK